MIAWFAIIAIVALAAWLAVRRSLPIPDESVDRLARLMGVDRAWGESDASLRRRSVALSRWPYEHTAPVVAWWARIRPIRSRGR